MAERPWQRVREHTSNGSPLGAAICDVMTQKEKQCSLVVTASSFGKNHGENENMSVHNRLHTLLALDIREVNGAQPQHW